MDRLSLFGLVIAIGAIVIAQLLEGGGLATLYNPAALVIVIGGSLGAAMIQTHWRTFSNALRMFPWVFVPPPYDLEAVINQVVSWSFLARREGLLGLERNLDDDLDPFIRKGMNMLIDGNDPDAIRQALYLELDVNDKELLTAAKVYESIGGYTPTLGIVGAVLGLIHVMGNLSKPELLGAGIATAFVATIYGVGLANLIFIPIYHKLRAVIAEQTRYRELLIEGLASIAAGENPRVIENKLRGFVVD